MPKLWIVHRHAPHRTALARLAALSAHDVTAGPPRVAGFDEAPRPDAVMLGLEDDFELELDFAHRLSERIQGTRWILLVESDAADEARRLFETLDPEVLEPMPSPRLLRAALGRAFELRRAESLAARRTRARIAERFSAWLGGVEVPGLLRALDPSLSHLPLLVRGVSGSGRGLLARYVELSRSGALPGDAGGHEAPRRIHGRELEHTSDLVGALSRAIGPKPPARVSLWIDEIDRLDASTQGALAEWIQHGAPTRATAGAQLAWVATAGASRWQDRLEPALERAFAPLVLELPSLASLPESLPRFAEAIATDWRRRVGGPPRRLDPSAVQALASIPWPGDRAEVEAILRASFAASARDPLGAEDLVFGPTSLRTAETAGPSPETEPAPQETEQPDQSAARAPQRPLRAGIPAPLPEDLLPEIDAELVEEEGDEAEPDGWEDDAEDADFDDSTLLSEASFGIAAVGREPTPPPGEPDWKRLARSLSHEIRNPLVSIRTFAELLPENFDDETFRERFVELVGRDVGHISDIVTRMQQAAENGDARATAIDVSSMVETLLDERRERIAEGRLLVLRELERERPMAWAEPNALRAALAGLIDRALEALPARGGLFVATRQLAAGPDGPARLRILLRHEAPDGSPEISTDIDSMRPEANALEYVLAETVARSSGGSLTVDTSDARELLVLLDLRTPD